MRGGLDCAGAHILTVRGGGIDCAGAHILTVRGGGDRLCWGSYSHCERGG